MLDVRPAHEYAAGHFPGAYSIPLGELADRIIELPTDQRIVVYCRGEFCLLARDAARILRDQGLDAYAMDEGVLEWRAGGWLTSTLPRRSWRAALRADSRVLCIFT